MSKNSQADYYEMPFITSYSRTRPIYSASLIGMIIFFLTAYVWTTPIANLGEVIAVWTGSLVSQQATITPMFVRYLREAFLLLAVLFGFVASFRYNRTSRFLLYVWFLVFMIAIHLFVSAALGRPLLLILAGFRWSMPFFLPFVLYPFLNGRIECTVSRALIGVFLIQFSLQLLQFLFPLSWFGVSRHGFGLRSPGVFLIPNTAAFFAIVVMHFSDEYSQINSNIKRLVRLLSTLSVALTASGTGYVVVLLYWIITWTRKRYHSVILLALPFVFAISLGGLLLVPRGGSGGAESYIRVSGGTRVNIFIDALKRAELYSDRFGAGTNTGLLLQSAFGSENDSIVADSTPASIVVNWGWAGLLGSSIILLSLWGIAFIRKHPPLTAALLITTLFSMTTIVSEVRPAGILALIAVASALRSSLRVKYMSESGT